MENEFMQLWRLVSELTEQLAQNRSITASLQAQAGAVNSAASHQITGFPLRRFNMHLTQEAYDTELELMNSSFIQHNAELQNENKQLAALLKEYEQALENVMSKFRTHAHATQQHELSLTRHYESLLLARESHSGFADLAASTAYSHFLARISGLLRAALKAAIGEVPEPELPFGFHRDQQPELERIYTVDDWALDRECELARLQHENQHLQRMLGLLPPASPPPPAQPRLPSISSMPFWDPLEGDRPRLTTPQHISPHVDDLLLRRHPVQISLDGPSKLKQTQPKLCFIPADDEGPPPPTRKMGSRRGGGRLIGGGGSYLSKNTDHQRPNTVPSHGTCSKPAWMERTISERNLNIQGPGGDHNKGTSGSHNTSTWEGLTAMYLNTWHPQSRNAQ